jgi:ribonuclease HI
LTGHLAALSRFISKLGEKALPFYRLLRKTDKFAWTAEAHAAFDDLKHRLLTSPVLVTPREKEPMLLYIAATNQVVSSALVVERAEDGKEHGVKRPVYYLSEVLSPTKQRYPHYQKLAYTIYMTGKKLPHYFECHSIIVVASTPVSSILNNPDAMGHVLLWGITLRPWEITYQRQLAIKSQVLSDIIVEWTKAQGDKMRYALRMRFANPSNNKAEYEVVLHGMRMAKACGATRIKIHGDLNLIVQQVMKECDAACANMIAYRAMYDKLEGNFEGCEVTHIGRESNDEVDNLANIGSKCLPIPPGVFFEEMFERSVNIKPAIIDPVLATRSGANHSGNAPATEKADPSKHTTAVMLVEAVWMNPYLTYLIRGELPEDTIHRRQVMRRSKAFTIIQGELYKHSTTGVLQRCIAPKDGIALLRDIHEETRGHHASNRTLVAKAFRSGFYWLSALHDAKNIVQWCDACQCFATKPHAPTSELRTIPLAWPFAQWGLDQVGPLPKSSRGSHSYVLVAVDKFSKWIKAVPVTNQEATTAVKFFESITCRYGVPNSIITDNGTNFTSGEFQEFTKELGIKIKYASVAHPKSNGQVEKANRLVCAGLKKRLLRPLKRTAGAWVEELPSVLWSLRTIPNSSTGYTPFFLLFGAEAVLSTDVHYCAPRVVAYVEEDAQMALEDALDLLDEARDIALARSAVY